MSIKNVITGFIGESKFWLKKNSPELLVAGGILCSAAAIGLAVYSTVKAEKVVTPAKTKINKLKEELNNDDLVNNGIINIEDHKKELNKVYANTGWKLLKIYSPSIILFASSVACTLSSHKIMNGRVMALSAAYSALDLSFKQYRERVANRIGNEIENKIFNDTTNKVVKYVDEDGKEQEVEIETEQGGSIWSVLYDEYNPNWESNGVLNLEFLEMQENYLQQKLVSQGYLFLWDVYKVLGYDETYLNKKQLQGSRVVGWIYDPNDKTRDSYVSFGLRDRNTGELTPKALNMRKYGEPSVKLDFNVDGDILTGNKSRTFFDAIKRG